MSPRTGAVLGADGAPGGWALAILPLDDGAGVRWASVRRLADALVPGAPGHRPPGDRPPRDGEAGDSGLRASLDDVDVCAVGVDMPIGLPATGRRPCDLEAKRRLGAAHARVFLAPPRAVLATGSHPEASALHRTLVDGRGLSIQTWHLLAKVAEVDELAGDARLTGRLVEVHPELSFAAMTGAPLVTKHRPEGRQARIEALRHVLPGLDGASVPRGEDGLDALAVAWSARRWLRGDAEVLPDGTPDRDECGRPMRIVY